MYNSKQKLFYNNLFLTLSRKSNGHGFLGLAGVYGRYNIIKNSSIFTTLNGMSKIVHYYISIGGTLLVFIYNPGLRNIVQRELQNCKYVIVSPIWRLGIFSNNDTYLLFLKKIRLSYVPNRAKLLVLLFAPYYPLIGMTKELFRSGIAVISLVATPVSIWTGAAANYQITINTGAKKITMRLISNVIKKAVSSIF